MAIDTKVNGEMTKELAKELRLMLMDTFTKVSGNTTR
jgi:hypothetical protein